MSTIRLPLYIILSLLSFTHCLTAQSFTESYKAHAAEWAQDVINNLTTEEIQLAANLLYVLHANALIDVKIRQFVIPITKLNQAIRSNIFNYKDTTNELSALKTLLERLSYILGARTIYNQTLQTCLHHYNNKERSPILSQLVIELQQYGQYALNLYAENQSEETTQRLNTSAALLQEHVEPLQAIADVHKGLANELFIDYFKNNEDTKNIIPLACLDELLKNNTIALHNAEQVLNALDITTEYALKLISCGNDIYKEHYSALYTYLTSETADKHYSSTLFGMNDMLSDEYKTVLPDPEHVFEHILQTIKLYTHIEVTQ